jgi:hypothetical protein
MNSSVLGLDSAKNIFQMYSIRRLQLLIIRIPSIQISRSNGSASTDSPIATPLQSAGKII